jgi:uncharacterized protein with PQ loop repeat
MNQLSKPPAADEGLDDSSTFLLFSYFRPASKFVETAHNIHHVSLFLNQSSTFFSFRSSILDFLLAGILLDNLEEVLANYTNADPPLNRHNRIKGLLLLLNRAFSKA